MISVEKRIYQRTYSDLAALFPSWLAKWDPGNSTVSLNELFSRKSGEQLRWLAECGVIEEATDFSGIYIFYKGANPFYVGISRNVVKRLRQHIEGGNHFSASLCYRMAIDHFLEVEGRKFEGKRKDLHFATWCRPAQSHLLNCNVAMLKIDNPIEMTLFEIYVAMELGTYYNEFKTH